jgi:hypothetical protein
VIFSSLIKTGYATTTINKAENLGVLIHNRTPTFIDIEAPVSQVWFGCTDEAPPEESSLMIFYVIIEGKETHEFHLRRMDDAQFCLKHRESEYKKIAKEAKTIRIVGSHSSGEEKGPQAPLSKRIPARFTSTPKIIHWVFQRMQVEGKCKAYFEHDCELPKYYWADTIPPK